MIQECGGSEWIMAAFRTTCGRWQVRACLEMPSVNHHEHREPRSSTTRLLMHRPFPPEARLAMVQTESYRLPITLIGNLQFLPRLTFLTGSTASGRLQFRSPKAARGSH